jgi:hypothetical protein
MKDLTDRALVGWRILLILLFFNMLVCAYSGRVGWMLFWAIAFSSGVHEHGYEYGKANADSDTNASPHAAASLGQTHSI